jgi:superoxide reductase
LTDDLFTVVNRAENFDNLTDLEKKHLPVIEAPDSVKAGESFEVTIEVGKLLTHPNELGHHIQWIVLLKGGVALATVHLTPVTTSPNIKLTVTLNQTETLRALERCNLHGEWEYTKLVKVE